MPNRVAKGAAQRNDEVGEHYELAISIPWWLNPVWPVLLLSGSMVITAMVLDNSIYSLWRVQKYLNEDLALTLTLALVATLVGILIGTGMAVRGLSVMLKLTGQQVHFLSVGYRIMFTLVLLGYAIWIASAVSQGVGFGDLIAVVDREPGAIRSLKSNARPIGGLTTMTQFAPVVAVIGLLLQRMGVGGRGWLVLIFLAGIRTMFYAERLALIEILIPVMVVAAVTVGPTSRWRILARIAPLVSAPLIWAVFAISEYTRSWVYYQTLTTLPFAEWVSARLAGYYVTAFNNSAILTHFHAGSNAEPYFSIPGVWNAPGAPAHGGVFGFEPEAWWVYTLTTRGNPEFNNQGSFLVTYAEFGLMGMLVFWLIVGVILGGLYSSMTKGSAPALLAYAVVFVGVLELPRFIYWTQGRATPMLLALIVIGLTYPPARQVLTLRTKLPHWASEPEGKRVLAGSRGQ